MGIEKASGDGGAKDGGEVSPEGAREVAPAAKAALSSTISEIESLRSILVPDVVCGTGYREGTGTPY